MIYVFNCHVNKGVTVPYQFREWELAQQIKLIRKELVISSHELELELVTRSLPHFMSWYWHTC